MEQCKYQVYEIDGEEQYMVLNQLETDDIIEAYRFCEAKPYDGINRWDGKEWVHMGQAEIEQLLAVAILKRDGIHQPTKYMFEGNESMNNELAPLPIPVKPLIHVGITDHLDPDVQAMMLAMYSRSYGPILDRMPKTPEEQDSLRARLKKFYVGYNHKSVGQLGTTTIWLEGVSQLAAKAIEDHPLFNGQESSTRYIDFSSQPNVVPRLQSVLDAEIASVQEELRGIYVDALPLVTARLQVEYKFGQPGRLEEQSDAVYAEAVLAAKTTWTNTIKARTFDICRGILPAGCTTNVAFQGTFDTINDHFGAMTHHPAEEMRSIAAHVLTQLKHTYPDATAGADALHERFKYISDMTMLNFYPPMPVRPILMHSKNLDEGYAVNWVARRKKFETVPRAVNINQRFTFGGKLDFGAFRDLHRHRNGVCLMPLLTAELGMHPWYTKELPDSINERLAKVIKRIEQLNMDFCSGSDYRPKVNLQYAVPMGCQVPVDYDCDYGQTAYLMELRSGKTVHQTLRHWIHAAFRKMQEIAPHFAHVIYPDLDEDNFTLKRGTQTMNGEFK